MPINRSGVAGVSAAAELAPLHPQLILSVKYLGYFLGIFLLLRGLDRWLVFPGAMSDLPAVVGHMKAGVLSLVFGLLIVVVSEPFLLKAAPPSEYQFRLPVLVSVADSPATSPSQPITSMDSSTLLSIGFFAALPLPDVDVRIVDAETGIGDKPVGEVGELIMHSPQHMLEYWNNPLETQETLRRRDDDGKVWLHTGDLAYIDADGYVFLVDRKKDMLKTSGFQVWPREIEEVISALPAVLEVGVAGVPDPVKGEVAKAWVVLKPGEKATEDEVRAYCRERLAPYKVPGRIEFRKDLPKTMVGKILRRALVAEDRAAIPG
jgi:long-chain acyl-CoA synthetase